MHYASTSQPVICTRDGNIPALRFRDAKGQEYWIVPKTSLNDRSTTVPRNVVRDEQGRIVYALPGGGSYVEDSGETA